MRSKLLLILITSVNIAAAQNDPIALHPQNPHYFLYRNKPTVLITSGEHYGAVMNLDFDFTKYLQTLNKDGLNLTRLFTGATYVEPQGAFNIERNTMAPAPLKYICPWARSNESGYANGGNKFDLTKWDTAYFSRLKKFMSVARENNVIVELTFFCPFYDSLQWKLSPFNNANNTKHVAGNLERTDIYTIGKNTQAVNELQAKLVKKIVTELNDYDNLMYELANEPYFGGITLEWQHFIATVIDSTEKKLPKKHLLTQNIANDNAVIENADPLVSVFNFHYASPPVAVSQNYQLNKVIGCNETGFKGTSDSVYRLQAWQFIVAGGALFNNLDYSFVAGHEDGGFKYPATQPGGGSVAYRKQLGYLKDFIYSFDFVKLTPDSAAIKVINAPGVSIQTLAETGKQYAAHIIGGNNIQLQLALPANKYKVTWIKPVNGKTISSEMINVHDALTTLVTPTYQTDIALRIIKQ
ncbi:MAG: hypothetical protein ABI921_06400 [Panacibacter sp.]